MYKSIVLQWSNRILSFEFIFGTAISFEDCSLIVFSFIYVCAPINLYQTNDKMPTAACPFFVVKIGF